jgi:cytochrome bd-type quinol oxidase subunit 1
MLENLDPVLLARIQFAFTISFHILFPAFTIGLASWLAVLEWRWLKTGNPVYAEVYRMWVKIFAVTFGMGVVSGVVMSFQFGTNWSVFSDRDGNVLGPLLGYEVLTAFFLEAGFLGIMLFGWEKVSRAALESIGSTWRRRGPTVSWLNVHRTIAALVSSATSVPSIVVSSSSTAIRYALSRL